MRYSTSEKFAFILLVEQSSLLVGQTLPRLCIRSSTFYGSLKRYQQDGVNGMEERKSSPRWVWNKLPLDQVAAIIDLALEKPEMSPQVLALLYSDEQSIFRIKSLPVIESPWPDH